MVPRRCGITALTTERWNFGDRLFFSPGCRHIDITSTRLVDTIDITIGIAEQTTGNIEQSQGDKAIDKTRRLGDQNYDFFVKHSSKLRFFREASIKMRFFRAASIKCLFFFRMRGFSLWLCRVLIKV